VDLGSCKLADFYLLHPDVFLRVAQAIFLNCSVTSETSMLSVLKIIRCAQNW